jgi:hypothetical protein
VCEQKAKIQTGQKEGKTNENREKKRLGFEERELCIKNDDKLCACTTDMVIDVIEIVVVVV